MGEAEGFWGDPGVWGGSGGWGGTLEFGEEGRILGGTQEFWGAPRGLGGSQRFGGVPGVPEGPRCLGFRPQGSAMDRMKKIKRQLSMTLRGGRAPEKSLGEPRDGHGSDSGERWLFKGTPCPFKGDPTPPLRGALLLWRGCLSL